MLQDNASNYDKGVLAEILEPIMGKGLIPADLETWKPRRRAIVPAFHKVCRPHMLPQDAASRPCTHSPSRWLCSTCVGNAVIISHLPLSDRLPASHRPTWRP